jgi:hypothetical protein
MTYRLKNKLSEICVVQSGYTARGRLELAGKGGVPAIQLRDLGNDDEFDPSGLPSYALSGGFERYWAGPGDVLFRSRGARNTAVTVAPKSKGIAVAILPLLVLRPDRDVIDPKYLTWFINQPYSQRYFDKWARGTRLRMIPKQRLEDLEVRLPDLATQRLIVVIDALARRERALAVKLAEKKLELTSFVLLEQVRKTQPHGDGAGL